MDCLRICLSFVICLFLTSFPQRCMALNITMSPAGDQYLLVGSTLQLNCTIVQTHGVALSSNDSYKALDLSIRHRNRSISHAQFEYYEPELTLALTIHHVTLADDGMYTCHLRNNNEIKYLTLFNVAEPPGEPTNLTCVSYNLNNMTCSFSLTNIGSNPAVNWTIEYKTEGSQDWIPMPESHCSLHDFSCSWDSVGQEHTKWTFNRATTYYSMRVWQQWAETTFRSRVWVFNISAIVKPNHVESLRPQLVSDNYTAMLDWDYPASIDPINMGQMEFSITVTHTLGWDSRHMIYRPPAPEEYLFIPEWPTKFQYNVTNLMAYSNYSVSVRTRSNQTIDDIYWSEPATVTFQTPASAPLEAPSVVEGGHWVQDTGQGCDGQFTCVTVYWKIPPERTWAGLVTEFWVNIDKPKSPRVTLRSVGMSTSLRLEGIVDQAEGYSVSVQMANHVGMSPKSMDVIVYPWKQARTMRADWVSVQQARDNALLSWSPPHDLCQDITMVTYFWCHIVAGSEANSLPDCQTLDWRNVTVDGLCEHSVYEWLNNTGDPSGMRYAVSISTSNRTGGMVWDKYRYSNYNIVPVKPLYSVKTVQEDAQSLEVATTFPDLPAINEGGQPSFLGLIYRKVTSPDLACPEDVAPQRFPVDFTNHTIMINNLQAGAQYVVCLRAENEAGNSPYGEPISMQLNKADSTKLVVTIAVVVSCLIVLIAATIFGLCKCRERIKRFINSKRQISLTFLHTKGNDGNTNEDTDSGHCTQTGTPMLHVTLEKPEHSINAVHVSTSNGSCLSGYLKINGSSDLLYSDREPGFELVERSGGQSNHGFAVAIDENFHSADTIQDNKDTPGGCQPLDDVRAPVQSGKDNHTRSQGAGESAVNLDVVVDTGDSGSGKDNLAEELTASPALSGAATADKDSDMDSDTTSVVDSQSQYFGSEYNSCPYRNPENISLDSSAFSEICVSNSFRPEDFIDSPLISQTELELKDEMCDTFVNFGFKKEEMTQHISVVHDTHSGAIQGLSELSSIVREPPVVVGSGHSGLKSSGDSVTSYSIACTPEGGGRERKESDDSGHFSQQNANSPIPDFKIDLDPLIGKSTKIELNSNIGNTQF
ncbi:uncharacterized protein LOC127861939 isoform X2 [Dreissena polymorpha]|uniref:uncharacterized protein LOC127861939 isoform X2 n=1 Tax=Dreissena polymorpha TaxID=45954 RepID=UPI00226555F3|nr:uncharacterized protein LOC127861939 isoform X2 [Dreissena polymorpha]